MQSQSDDKLVDDKCGEPCKRLSRHLRDREDQPDSIDLKGLVTNPLRLV